MPTRVAVLAVMAALNGCAALPGTVMFGALLAEGISTADEEKGRPPDPRRDFFVSGRPVAVEDLDCPRLQQFRVDDSQYIVEGCGARALYVLTEAVEWTRVGEVVLVPPPLPVVEVAATGRCSSSEVAELVGNGVSPTAISQACNE